MKVLILNTSERTGGAAVAANRLMKALCKQGVEAKMLVRDKQSADERITSVNQSLWQRRLNFWRFAWERLVIFLSNKLDQYGSGHCPSSLGERGRRNPSALGQSGVPFLGKHPPTHCDRQTDCMDHARPLAGVFHLPLCRPMRALSGELRAMLLSAFFPQGPFLLDLSAQTANLRSSADRFRLL